jgi:hypothetical protein
MAESKMPAMVTGSMEKALLTLPTSTPSDPLRSSITATSVELVLGSDHLLGQSTKNSRRVER